MEEFLNTIRESGSKLTNQRRKILQVIFDADKPQTLREIHNDCRGVDFTSVYRAIKRFETIGIVEEILFADKKIRYKLISQIHQHHIICSSCGEIKVLPICLLSEIKKLTNYKITKHTLEFMGLCSECQ